MKEEDLSMLIKENHSVDSFKVKKRDLNTEDPKTKLENKLLNQQFPQLQNRYRTELNKKIKKRGNYKICTLDKKMEAIRMA